MACAADPAAARTVQDPPEPLAADPLFEDPVAFELLPPPGPTGWRARFDEPGQSYVDYLSTVPRRPTADAERLYLLPLGEMGTAFVVDAEVTYIVRTPPTDQMAALLAVYFGLPTEVPVCPPRFCRSWSWAHWPNPTASAKGTSSFVPSTCSRRPPPWCPRTRTR